MNDDHIFLANAYIDGVLTDDERQIAESDPIVMAEVVELRALVAELHAPDTASEHARESALGAALAAFDELHSASASSPATPPRQPASATNRWNRWLAVAAAVVAVGLLGAVVVSINGQEAGDFDSADEASDDATATAEMAPMETEEAVQATDGAGDTVLLDDDASEPSADASNEARPNDSVAATADDGDLMVEAESADESFDESAADAADESEMEVAGDDAPATATDITDPQTPFANPTELARIGELLIDQRDARELPPTPEFACSPVDPDTGESIDVLSYGTFTEAAGSRLVLVGVDESVVPPRVVALDPDTCQVLLAT